MHMCRAQVESFLLEHLENLGHGCMYMCNHERVVCVIMCMLYVQVPRPPTTNGGYHHHLSQKVVLVYTGVVQLSCTRAIKLQVKGGMRAKIFQNSCSHGKKKLTKKKINIYYKLTKNNELAQGAEAHAEGNRAAESRSTWIQWWTQ